MSDVKAENVQLSLMPCYAGLQRAEVMTFRLEEEDEVKEPFMYFQFIEGCGYQVYQITPDEAEKIAAMLLRGAKRTRELNDQPFVAPT